MIYLIFIWKHKNFENFQKQIKGSYKKVDNSFLHNFLSRARKLDVTLPLSKLKWKFSVLTGYLTIQNFRFLFLWCKRLTPSQIWILSLFQFMKQTSSGFGGGGGCGRNSTPCRPKRSPLCTILLFWDIYFWLTDLKIFLQALSEGSNLH